MSSKNSKNAGPSKNTTRKRAAPAKKFASVSQLTEHVTIPLPQLLDLVRSHHVKQEHKPAKHAKREAPESYPSPTVSKKAKKQPKEIAPPPSSTVTAVVEKPKRKVSPQVLANLQKGREIRQQKNAERLASVMPPPVHNGEQ